MGKRIIKPKDVILEASEEIDRLTEPYLPVPEKKIFAHPSHVDNPERELTEFEKFLAAKESTAMFV